MATKGEFEDELEEQLVREGRRGLLVALPFLLPTTYLFYVILGPSLTTAVRTAFVLQVGIIAARVAYVALLSGRRLGGSERRWIAEVLETLSGLSVSMGIANIVLSPDRLSTEQVLELSLVVTAVSTLALQGMAARLFTYLGYVAVQVSALAIVVVRTKEPALFPRLPLMVLVFAVALAAIAVRANAALRSRLLLGIQLREAGWRDALTGLRNRRFASTFAKKTAAEIFGEPLPLAGRRSSGLAFLLIDIDHFKRVNDTHGHAVGDDVLVAFGALARATLRQEDIVARWGGEEFLVILEVVDEAAAFTAAERLRLAIATQPIALSNRVALSVTCSIGVGLLSRDDATLDDRRGWQQVVERADRALYRAKAGGRNRTACAWHPHEPAASQPAIEQTATAA